MSNADSARTADLSRRHRVTTSPRRVVTVTGGKLTTYRSMAADTVDHVVGLLGRRLARSGTRRLPLWGADNDISGTGDPDEARLGLSPDVAAHLRGRYGSEAGAVAAMVAADPGLGQPLVEGLPYLRAEAVFAARYEMAETLDDVLARRTRASILDAAATVAAAPAVARLLAPELGWSPEREASEISSVVDRVGAQAKATGLPVPTPHPVLP